MALAGLSNHLHPLLISYFVCLLPVCLDMSPCLVDDPNLPSGEVWAIRSPGNVVFHGHESTKRRPMEVTALQTHLSGSQVHLNRQDPSPQIMYKPPSLLIRRCEEPNVAQGPSHLPVQCSLSRCNPSLGTEMSRLTEPAIAGMGSNTFPENVIVP